MGGNARRVIGVNQCGAAKATSGSPVTQRIGGAVRPPVSSSFGYDPTWLFELYMGNGVWNVVNVWEL